MDNQSSTPCPWIIKKVETTCGYCYKIGAESIVNAKNGGYCCLYYDETSLNETPQKEIESNAALIVKAVNNHEALLEACRRAYLLLDAENNHGMGKRTDALSYEVYKDLEQAIANAENK